MCKITRFFLILLLFSSCLSAVSGISPSLKCLTAPKFDSEEEALRIQLRAEGFEAGTAVQLATLRSTNKSMFPAALSINASGEVILDASGQALVLALFPYNSEHFPQGFALGEPVQYTISAGANKPTASVTIIPFPNRIADRNGHHLWIDGVNRERLKFGFHATGFQPHEIVDTISIYEEKPEFGQAVASESGEIDVSVTLLPSKKSAGRGSFEIRGRNTLDLKISYDWGGVESTKNGSSLGSLLKYFNRPNKLKDNN